MGKKQTRWGIGLRVIFSLLAILVVMVIVIIVVANKGKFSIDNITRAISYRNIGSAEQTDKYNFDDRKSNKFSVLGDGLLVASELGYEYYVKSGELFDSLSMNAESPAISTNGIWAAVYDIGGSSIGVLNESGAVYNMETEGDIYSVKINDSGWIAVCTTTINAKGLVKVYNEEGTGAYEFFVRSGYPVCAAVSPDCTGMYVLVITENGSSIMRYDLSSEEPKETYLAEDKIYIDIEYTSSNSVIAISQDNAIWLNTKCEETGSYDYSGMYLGGYEVDGTMLLYLSDYLNANSGKLVLLDSSGNISAECEITGSVRDISYSGKYTGVLYSDSIAIYNSSLNIYADTEETANASEILMREDGTMLLISAFQATLYIP